MIVRVFYYSAVAGGLLVSCVEDAGTEDLPEPKPLAILQFEESAIALGLDAENDFSDSYLKGLGEDVTDAGLAAGDAGSALDASAGEAAQPPTRGPAANEISLFGGMAAGDFDNDGLTDVAILRGEKRGRLFRNLGNKFVDVTNDLDLQLPELASGAAFVDVDGDTFIDLLVGGLESPAVWLFKNVEGERFELVESSGLASPVPVLGFAAGDIDGDRDIDLLALRTGATFAESEPRPGLLFVNNGEGQFEDESAALSYPLSEGGREAARTGAFSDLDSDGDLDLLLVQDYGNTRVYENETSDKGKPKFSDTTDDQVITAVRGQGLAVGDYDNDGDMDWFVTGVLSEDGEENGGPEGNRLYRNDEDRVFADVSDAAEISAGSWGTGACFADFNNDTLLDIFHVNGSGFGEKTLPKEKREFLNDDARLFLQRSDAPGKFVEVASEASIEETGEGRGVLCFDFDQDGDVDILINNVGGRVRLQQNTLNPAESSAANWLGVRLVGVAPNYSALGARVTLTAGGVTQTREVQLRNTLGASQPLTLHFGLNALSLVDELRVAWSDGTEDSVVEGVLANQNLTIRRK